MPTGKTPLGTDMTLVSMQTGNRLRTLERLRDRLAEQIDACENGRDLALLSTRLQSVLGEIAELAPPEAPSALDVITARRQARRDRGEPVVVDPTAGRGAGRGHG
jgi:hypothetical protein